MTDTRKYIERATSTLKRDENSGQQILEMQFGDIDDARGAANFLGKSGISLPDEIYLNTTPPTIQVGTLEGLEKLKNIVDKKPEEYQKTKNLLDKMRERNTGLGKTTDSDQSTAEEYYKKKWGESVGTADIRSNNGKTFGR